MPKAASKAKKGETTKRKATNGKVTFACGCNGGCKGRKREISKALYKKLLGDRLCWVYDPPVRLYGELSILGLHFILCSLSIPLILSYTRTLLTHIALIPFL